MYVCYIKTEGVTCGQAINISEQLWLNYYPYTLKSTSRIRHGRDDEFWQRFIKRPIPISSGFRYG